jgi:hypothetical protein
VHGAERRELEEWNIGIMGFKKNLIFHHSAFMPSALCALLRRLFGDPGNSR